MDAGAQRPPLGDLDIAHEDPVVTWAGALVGVGVAAAFSCVVVVVVVSSVSVESSEPFSSPFEAVEVTTVVVLPAPATDVEGVPE
jgi:hypothetical protein